MIQKHKGELVCHCDGCGDEIAGGVQDDFREFVQEVKDAGWKIRKNDDDEWEHYCEECA